MSPRRKGARPPWVTDDGRDPLKRGALKLGLVGALLVWVLFLLYEPQEVRYGRSHGTSLRALMDRAEVAALAELTSEDSPWGPHVATYRVQRALKGPVDEGDQLEVVGPHRLPYHGRSSFFWSSVTYYEARPGQRVFLFLRSTPDRERFTVVDPSGALHLTRLDDHWPGSDMAAVAEVFADDLEELVRIQGATQGRWLSRERDWLLNALSNPLTSARAAGDLVNNWRGRPRLDSASPLWADAGDARAEMGPADLVRLHEALADRRLTNRVRDDVAWLLADERGPALTEALTRELVERLAVAAFDPDTERADRHDPDELFPGDFAPEFAVHHSYQLLAALAYRAQDAVLDARLEGWLEAKLDADEVRAYRRFTERWLELQGLSPADTR
jgi:hypothetical protein